MTFFPRSATSRKLLPAISCRYRIGAISLLFLVIACAAAQTTATSATVVIRAAELFDPESGQLIDKPTVTITGDHIDSVTSGSGGTTPVAARVIDLGAATIL